MAVELTKMVQRGSVFLIEILVSLALLTACAGIVAQYCWRIHATQQETTRRIQMLTIAQNDMDSFINTQACTQLMRMEQVSPRIQSDTTELATLYINSFYRVELPSAVTLVCAGVVEQGEHVP